MKGRLIESLCAMCLCHCTEQNLLLRSPTAKPRLMLQLEWALPSMTNRTPRNHPAFLLPLHSSLAHCSTNSQPLPLTRAACSRSPPALQISACAIPLRACAFLQSLCASKFAFSETKRENKMHSISVHSCRSMRIRTRANNLMRAALHA